MNTSYLTDAELEHLIAEIEAEDLHPAPPGLLERILEQADTEKDDLTGGQTQRSTNEITDLSKNNAQEELIRITGRRTKQSGEMVRNAGKRAYFRRYCLRVATSVAAAIALLFLLPQTLDRLPDPDSFPVKNERTVYSREEIRDENRIMRTLRDSHFLTGGWGKNAADDEHVRGE